MRFVIGPDYGLPHQNPTQEEEETIDRMLRRYGIAYVCDHPEILFQNTRDPVARFIEAYRILQKIYTPVPAGRPAPDFASMVRNEPQPSYGSTIEYRR